MLKGAIRDDNPVLVLEHKALLSSKGTVPVGSDDAAMPIGPRVLRAGKDVTIVATLAMVGRALEAAELLAAEGIDAEIIDLRVLRPFDVSAVSDSVRKTSRLVLVEEQVAAGGWSASVVADVVDQVFDWLDAPPVRVTLPDYPLPYSPPLEDEAIPSPERIADAARKLMRDTGR
jgi:pyruvate dehydrogenase E1 component beta subunit